MAGIKLCWTHCSDGRFWILCSDELGFFCISLNHLSKGHSSHLLWPPHHGFLLFTTRAVSWRLERWQSPAGRGQHQRDDFGSAWHPQEQFCRYQLQQGQDTAPCSSATKPLSSFKFGFIAIYGKWNNPSGSISIQVRQTTSPLPLFPRAGRVWGALVLQQELFEHHKTGLTSLWPRTGDFGTTQVTGIPGLLPADQGAGPIWDTSYTSN